MVIVEIKGLTKDYGKIRALDNVSIKVNEGEIFGLLGPNGSGKSTMIKCITAQIKPTSGSITVDGIDVEKFPIKIRTEAGIIPEQENPPSFLSAEEYLYFVASMRNMKNPKHKIDEWFSLLEFEDQRQILCKDLSRGTRQKLMFSQAFMDNPKVAFIDEPLVNLDPVSQRIIKDFLIDYAKKGNTVFISTHALDIAEEICDEVCILHKGNVLYQGVPKKNMESFFLESVRNKVKGKKDK
jgi:ABC-2 type transport system ATP-binding protein